MSNQTNLLGAWIRRFLLEHLVAERNLARNTQRSYRDAFAQLMPFISRQAKTAVDRLAFDDLTPDCLRGFLAHLEADRGCTARTRNQRLAAVHAFAHFVAVRAPDRIDWCSSLRAIPFKSFNRPALCYLDSPEIDALIAAPDCARQIGRRDHALLLFLYNTGARASEAVAVTLADLERRPDGTGSVRLTGKGGKTRFCPLWPTTVEKLRELAGNRKQSEKLFINQRRQPLTRFGVHSLVARYVAVAAKKIATLAKKRIGPHTIRHSTATHLLRAGVDINTIRSWLGHVSIDTTNAYADVDLETKANMLAACEFSGPKPSKRRPWKSDPKLMEFLRAL
ncbi:MAG: tyrosine-type recombinase/integrase [Candidatus Korobacteraceae bacterium]|jgi:site-specific recombinase XerD